jgi:hypothetical protein
METDENIADEVIYRILNKEASEQDEKTFRQWLGEKRSRGK